MFSLMIVMIAAIAEVFFFSAIAAITAMVAIIWKPGFNLIMAYFKRKDCLQRNLYLNCASFVFFFFPCSFLFFCFVFLFVISLFFD